MKKADRAEIQRLDEILRKWRAKHSSPTPLPDEAWSGAVRLAAKLGVGLVAKELGLDHGKLKRLTGKKCRSEEETGVLPTFLELRPKLASEPTGTALASVSCAVEVEAAGGGVLRARLEGVSVLEIGTLFREFAR